MKRIHIIILACIGTTILGCSDNLNLSDSASVKDLEKEYIKWDDDNDGGGGSDGYATGNYYSGTISTSDVNIVVYKGGLKSTVKLSKGVIIMTPTGTTTYQSCYLNNNIIYVDFSVMVKTYTYSTFQNNVETKHYTTTTTNVKYNVDLINHKVVF